MTDQDTHARVTELIRDARISMFTTMTGDGRQVSRPMALQDVEFDGDLWFFAYEDSPKVAEITIHPEVNVSFSNQRNSAWVSISGRAEVVNDRARAKELWHPFLEAWFPDGLDTLGLTLIKVNAMSAEYWDAPGGRMITLIRYAASALTHKSSAIGEHRTVKLG